MSARVYLCLLLFLVGGAGPGGAVAPASGDVPTRTVYVVRHDWHAGIVVPRSHIPEGTWPGLDDFPRARYLEVGWGDRQFYQAPEPSFGLAVKALLWPTPGVVHVVGFDAPVRAYFPASEVAELTLTVQGFAALCRFVGDAYARDERGAPRGLGPGLYGNSRFYASGLDYSLFTTCNVWTARALRAAGQPIDPGSAVTVAGLMRQVRRLAEDARVGGAGAGDERVDK